jgi:TctA family transporter
VTALMLAAMMIHGVQPGPMLMTLGLQQKFFARLLRLKTKKIVLENAE